MPSKPFFFFFSFCYLGDISCGYSCKKMVSKSKEKSCPYIFSVTAQYFRTLFQQNPQHWRCCSVVQHLSGPCPCPCPLGPAMMLRGDAAPLPVLAWLQRCPGRSRHVLCLVRARQIREEKDHNSFFNNTGSFGWDLTVPGAVHPHILCPKKLGGARTHPGARGPPATTASLGLGTCQGWGQPSAAQVTAAAHPWHPDHAPGQFPPAFPTAHLAGRRTCRLLGTMPVPTIQRQKVLELSV